MAFIKQGEKANFLTNSVKTVKKLQKSVVPT
jgi:hypothetical protein